MRARWVGPLASLLAVAFTASIAPIARAADGNEEIAKDLFDKGVAKMEKGKCDETPTDLALCRQAKDDFHRAYELAPNALGALRNLAYVEKGLGMVASAARDFRELARKAPLDPKPERHKWAEYARKEVDDLTPKVPHVVVKLAERPAGTKVTLDGTPLLEAAWDTEIDVDPGEHAIHAEAPGRLPFEGTLVVAQKQTKSIAVSLPIDTAPPVATTKTNVAPIVVTIVGAVGVGAGLTLGYLAMKKKSDSCGSDKLCDPDGLKSGKSLANASTVVTSIGGAALVGGIVWWLLKPHTSSAPANDDKASAQITPYFDANGAGVAAFGRF